MSDSCFVIGYLSVIQWRRITARVEIVDLMPSGPEFCHRTVGTVLEMPISTSVDFEGNIERRYRIRNITATESVVGLPQSLLGSLQ